MSKYLKISIIILVLFVGYAPSCVDEEAIAIREEAILNETRGKIRAEFETEYLTKASLFGYEATAKQKLSDFVDYLHIVADTSLDLSFRVQAAEMIKNTFFSENIILQLAPPNKGFGKQIDVSILVEKGLEERMLLPFFSIDSIHIQEPIHRTGNNSYSGTLGFIQLFNNSTGPSEIINVVAREADIYLKKEDKLFGSDTLRVWNVRLGEIR